MKMEMQLTGFDELIAELEGMEISEQKERKALSESGEIIRKSIEEKVAFKTGNSKRNVKKQIRRLDDGNLGCKVTVNSWYSGFNEWGTTKNKKNIGKVENAIEDVADKAVEVAKNILLRQV